MIPHDVRLTYSLSPGWMTPFVEGLSKGDAVARRCARCAFVSFPPIRTCECGTAEGNWVTLSGTADICFRTHGSAGDFALVAFDGADTKSVVRLEKFPLVQTAGKLLPQEIPLPALVLHPVKGDLPT
ncbi:MAG: hypothetical protein ABJN26_23135 [Stappiaceae bacterium]